MGNIIHTRPPETSTLGVPILRTPFSDITSQIGHCDGDECLAFQLRFIDCCEAHGSVMAKTKCKYYYQDFIECSRKWKQMCRISDMTAMHYHKWLQGMLGDGPKHWPFYETPRYDAYAPNFLLEDTHWKV